MSESVLGVSVAATRQNDGRFAYGLAPPPPRRPLSGGTNVPGATTSARLIVPAFKAISAKLSHVAADARVAATAVRNNASAMTTFIVRSPVPGPRWLLSRTVLRWCGAGYTDFGQCDRENEKRFPHCYTALRTSTTTAASPAVIVLAQRSTRQSSRSGCRCR